MIKDRRRAQWLSSRASISLAVSLSPAQGLMDLINARHYRLFEPEMEALEKHAGLTVFRDINLASPYLTWVERELGHRSLNRSMSGL